MAALSVPKTKRRISPNERRRWLWGMFFIAPVVLGLLIFTLTPMLLSIYYSFTKYDMISQPKFIGFDNFKWLFDVSRPDSKFVDSLWVTIRYSVIAVPLGMLLSLVLALVLNKELKGIYLYRVIFYIPAFVPAVASAILFSDLYNVKYGIMNAILNFLGLPSYTWISRAETALPAMIVMSLWGVGSGTTIWLAGLKGVPRSFYEAAEVDGANLFQRIWNITIPMISPVIFYNLVTGIIAALQTFVAAFVMTNGGPDNSTLFIVLFIYNTAFANFKMGRAAAMSWILFALIAALTAIIFKTSSWVYYEGGEN